MTNTFYNWTRFGKCIVECVAARILKLPRNLNLSAIVAMPPSAVRATMVLRVEDEHGNLVVPLHTRTFEASGIEGAVIHSEELIAELMAQMIQREFPFVDEVRRAA